MINKFLDGLGSFNLTDGLELPNAKQDHKGVLLKPETVGILAKPDRTFYDMKVVLPAD